MLVVLLQARRDGRREDDAVHAVLPLRAEVAGDLATTHREADEGGVAQVEVTQHGVEVPGQGVVVVRAVLARLVRGAEPAPVVGDDPVAGGR